MENITLIIPAKHESESLPVVLEELKKFNFQVKIVLEKNDIKTIEFICYHEMKYMNYNVINKFNKFDQIKISDIKIYPKSKLANWIKPYAIDQNKKKLSKIINDEKQRLRIIKNTKYLDGKIKLKFQIIA